MNFNLDDKLLIIIPVFNEEENLQGLINSFKNISLNIEYDILFINDCSTDKSLQLINSSGYNFLDLPVNLGIGGAMQTGYIFALNNNYNYAIQIDGDGQHPPSEIMKLLTQIQKNNCDVVIGSRYLKNEGFQSTVMRRIGINFLSRIIKIITKKKVKDVTSGLRLFNEKAIKIAATYYPDEYPEPESIVLFDCYNLKISEVAVSMKERRGGVSSIRHLLSIYYMFKVSLAIVFSFIKFKSRKYE